VDKKLTVKQKLFCDEYLKTINGKQSAISAGYSKNAAESQASTLLTYPKVKAYLKKRMDARSARTEITQDMVIRRWGLIAFANIKDFIVWDSKGVVRMKGSDELTRDQAASISEIIQVSTKDGISFRFKMKDDQKALDAIAKHLGMFMDRGLDPQDPLVTPEQINRVEREAKDRLATIKERVH